MPKRIQNPFIFFLFSKNKNITYNNNNFQLKTNQRQKYVTKEFIEVLNCLLFS